MNLGLVIVLLLMLHVVMKFNLGQDSEARFGQDFEVSSIVKIVMFSWDFEVDAWSRFWKWNLIKICVWTWYELNPRVRCAFGNVCKLSLVLNLESRAGLNWGRNVGGDQIAQLGKWHQTKISNGGRVFIERHTSRPETYLFQLYRWWTLSTFWESQAFIELRGLFPSLDLCIQHAQHFEVCHSKKKETNFHRSF